MNLHYDLVEKDSNYYSLVSLTPRDNQSWYQKGTYINKFNHVGDSMGLVKIDNVSVNFNTIAPTNDKGFIVAGNSLLKLDSNYKMEWRKEFKKGVSITSVAQAADGGYYGAGSYYDESINRNRMFAFKTDANGNIDGNANNPAIVVFPNPAKNELRIDLPYQEDFILSMVDIQGRKCMEFTTTGSTLADINFLSEGMYVLFIKNSHGDIVKTKKFVKQN